MLNSYHYKMSHSMLFYMYTCDRTISSLFQSFMGIFRDDARVDSLVFLTSCANGIFPMSPHIHTYTPAALSLICTFRMHACILRLVSHKLAAYFNILPFYYARVLMTSKKERMKLFNLH